MCHLPVRASQTGLGFPVLSSYPNGGQPHSEVTTETGERPFTPVALSHSTRPRLQVLALSLIPLTWTDRCWMLFIWAELADMESNLAGAMPASQRGIPAFRPTPELSIST